MDCHSSRPSHFLTLMFLVEDVSVFKDHVDKRLEALFKALFSPVVAAMPFCQALAIWPKNMAWTLDPFIGLLSAL